MISLMASGIATLGIVLASGAPQNFGRVDPIALYDRELVFDIYRRGTQIGTHKVSFERNGNELRAISETAISVRFLSFEVYKFSYRSEEIVRAGSLVSIRAAVDDNGEKSILVGTQERDFFKVAGSRTSASFGAALLPTTHWNAETIHERRVLNTLTGQVNEIEVVRAGDETVPTEDGETRATRYVYSGDLNVEVWYDPAGRWVKLRFQGRDGAPITYQCNRCRGASAVATQ